MEWIYAQTKVSSSGSLELALEEMKERRTTIYTFFAKQLFRRSYLIVSMPGLDR